jgi:transposase InsO family protein
MIIELINEAKSAGARLHRCCEVVELDVRTVQRWLKHGPGGGEDRRRGPKTAPANKLSGQQRQETLRIVNAPEFVDLTPHQIVPKLADMGLYISSESTIYRLLRQEKLNGHRGRARPPTRHRPNEYEATGPNQVWCWDITYLHSPIRGMYYYLYLFLDVWSRKIVGCAVLEEESNEAAARLFREICAQNNVDPRGLVLHSDNGGPMKGATMLATLQKLGVVPSFSRPSVSDDNAFVEALFRTAKYRPSYPSGPFASLKAAQDWVETFVSWYNNDHQHSAIRFVTPAQRHDGLDVEILARRHEIYQRARERNPNRWSGQTRNWSPIETVKLNPRRDRADHTTLVEEVQN